MSNTYLFDKLEEFKSKFKKNFQHNKKIRSLENFSSVAPFHHKRYLFLIKNCMNDGFLEEKEAEFLDHMLNKYEVNYLDWCHKTRWLKKKMSGMYEENFSQAQQFHLPLNGVPIHKEKVPLHNVPLELLRNQPKQHAYRRY